MDEAGQGEQGSVERADNADQTQSDPMLGSLDRKIHSIFEPIYCLIQTALESFDRLFQPVVAALDRLFDIALCRGKIGLAHELGDNVLGQGLGMGFGRFAIDSGTFQRLRVG